MAQFIYQNANNEQIDLSNNEYFWLTNVDGQTRAGAEIASVSNGLIDGDIVNNIKLQPRTIILDLTIKKSKNVEMAKRSILSIIKPKQKGYLLWTQDDRHVQIEAYIEAIDMPRWTNGVVMQVTLHCSQPYWEDVQDVLQEISDIIDLHYFTRSETDMLYFPVDGLPMGYYNMARTKKVSNYGDVAVGFVCEIIAYGEVINPELINERGEFMKVNTTLAANDVLRIETTRGKKSISKNGVNIIHALAAGSTWLKIEHGHNEFTIGSDDESINNMYYQITYKQRYV